MRIILVADHASIDFGGEAALPCHYFRVLLSRNMDVHLIVHERSKAFLTRHFAEQAERIHYIKDSKLHRFVNFFQKNRQTRIKYLTFGFLLRILTQLRQKPIVIQLILDPKNTIVHQVIPVSPKAPSLMSGFQCPLVFGPLNGGMTYPHAFRNYEGYLSSWFRCMGLCLSGVANKVFSGKLHANMVLVANDRTRHALPKGLTGHVRTIVENGVDLSVWNGRSATARTDRPQFIYVGRLVDWKAVDILLEAFFKACESFGEMTLHIIGDGDKRQALENIVNKNRLSDSRIIFHGWLPQSQIAPILSRSRALLLPSLHECGGAVVLEAMASSIAVVSTNWGGPTDYLDKRCGILIYPSSRAALVDGFSQAMSKLAKEPELASTMGVEGRKKVEREYNWEKKVDDIVVIYRELLAG